MALSDRHKQLDLERVITIPAMQRAWKESVRNGLRRQSVGDLHDYYDIHRNLRSILPRVRSDILAGTYRPREPEVITLEKKHGVARRLVIPSPVDAIVLQTIVDAIEPRVRQKQRSRRAYYSRSHDAPKMDDFEGTFGYPWWLLWPKFQKEIWEFARASKYTVVTDLANYFDSIPLAKLRNSIATLDAFEESVLDLLFFLLESFVWRPDYIPHSGVGLPQINFDAPRLLSYAYLFPADEMLERETGERFVRWMDDIDFGAESIPEGRNILARLDSLLSGLGVRLNVAKTQILSQEDSAKHFWIGENLYLNVALNLAKQPLGAASKRLLLRSAEKRFGEFVRAEQVGAADKIWKRYFTLCGYLGSTALEPYVSDILREKPSLRESATRYLYGLGVSPTRVSWVLAYLASGFAVDDASFVGACRLLVEWSIEPRDPSVQRILAFALSQASVSGLRAAHLGGALAIVVKYGSRKDLESFVWKTTAVWTRSEWAARQIAAVYGIVSPRGRALIKQHVVRAGLLDALQVLTHIEQLQSRKVLDRQIVRYLAYPPGERFPYPLCKMLVGESLIRGALQAPGKEQLLTGMGSVAEDPVFVAILSGYAS